MVRISVRALDDMALPIVGFMLRNHMGLDFAGTNTAREGFELPPMAAGDIYTVDFHLHLPELYPSSFSFSPAIADGTLLSLQDVRLDRQRHRAADERHRTAGYGHMHLPCRVEMNRACGMHAGAALEPQLG